MNREPRPLASGRHDGRASDPVRAELAALAPGVAVPGLPDGRHLLLKEHMMAEIRRDTAGEPQPVRRDPRRWKRIAVPLAAAAAAVAIVAGVAVVDDGPAKPEVGAEDSRAATGLLIQAAANAEIRRPAAPRDNQFTYVEAFARSTALIYRTDGATPALRTPPAGKMEMWVPVGDTGPTLTRYQYDPTYTGGGTPPPADMSGEWRPGDAGFENPSYRFLQTLPTDPDALLKLLRREAPKHGDNPRDQQAFTMIGDLLRTSVAPPALTAALYRAAARLPGVTVVTGVADSLGRIGTAVTMKEVQKTRTEWIFDPVTAEFLGERTVVLDGSGGMPAGTVMIESAVVRRGIADKPGEPPVTVVAARPDTASGA